MSADTLDGIIAEMEGRAGCLDFIGCDYANVYAPELRAWAKKIAALYAAQQQQGEARDAARAGICYAALVAIERTGIDDKGDRRYSGDNFARTIDIARDALEKAGPAIATHQAGGEDR